MEKSHGRIKGFSAGRKSGKRGVEVRVVNWKKNLVVIWLSQFLSIAGFGFALPFAPYYMQDLGVTDPVSLKMWIALFGAATPLTLAIFSPIWGLLADRYGRRIMLLRANFAGAVVVTLMGTVHSVPMLIVLRLLQGVFTGTMTAAQTMVAVQTPNERSGRALGALSAAVYSGGLTGAFLGGILADLVGFRASFVVGGALLLAAGLLVLFGTKEEFTRPVPLTAEEEDIPRAIPRHSVAVFAVLGLIGAMAFVRQFDSSFLPLLVQEIHGGVAGASIWSGTLLAVSGIAGLAAGPLFGLLADRRAPYRIAELCALGACVLLVPIGLTHSFQVLLPLRFIMIFFSGGMEPVLQIWLSRVTHESRRGSVFGWAGTARSVGWIASPLCGGLVTSAFGLRSIFFVGSALFIGLAVLIGVVARKVSGRRDAEAGDPRCPRNQGRFA